jgi:hypothetical protein
MKLIITGGSGQLARRAAELALAKVAPYMSACTDHVAKLARRPPKSLRQVLEAKRG